MRNHIDYIMKQTPLEAVKHRLPWLLIGLLGSLVVAQIINSFSEILRQHIILVAFIPLVVYMSDAVSNQIEAMVIRDESLHPKFSFTEYLSKQLIVVTIIGIITAVVLFVLTYYIYGSFAIALIVSISLFLAVISAIFTGLVIPYLLAKIGLDPANASGPIATIIQDLISVSIYFLVAVWLL